MSKHPQNVSSNIILFLLVESKNKIIEKFREQRNKRQIYKKRSRLIISTGSSSP